MWVIGTAANGIGFELGIGGGLVSLARASMASIVWRAWARPIEVGERWSGWDLSWVESSEPMEGEAGSILISGSLATGMSDRPEVRLRLRAGRGGLDGVSANSKAARASQVEDLLTTLICFDGVVTRLDGVLNGIREWFIDGLVG